MPARPRRSRQHQLRKKIAQTPLRRIPKFRVPARPVHPPQTNQQRQLRPRFRRPRRESHVLQHRRNIPAPLPLDRPRPLPRPLLATRPIPQRRLKPAMPLVRQMFHQLSPPRRRTSFIRRSRHEPCRLILVPLLQHRPSQFIPIAKMPVKTPLAHMQIPRQHFHPHSINPVRSQSRKPSPHPIPPLQGNSLRCPYRCR